MTVLPRGPPAAAGFFGHRPEDRRTRCQNEWYGLTRAPHYGQRVGRAISDVRQPVALMRAVVRISLDTRVAALWPSYLLATPLGAMAGPLRT